MVEALLPQLRALCTAMARVEAEIDRLCEAPRPQAPRFAAWRRSGLRGAPARCIRWATRSLPGRRRATEVRCIAPVTERSGNNSWVHRRWACPKFLRQSFVEWAAETITRSFWGSCVLRQPSRQRRLSQCHDSRLGIQTDPHRLPLLDRPHSLRRVSLSSGPPEAPFTAPQVRRPTPRSITLRSASGRGLPTSRCNDVPCVGGSAPKSQRAAVFDVVQKSGLEPSEFTWATSGNGMSKTIRPALVHTATQSFFVFDEFVGQHACAYSPGHQMVREENLLSSWSLMLSAVASWLRHLKRELEATDPWEAAKALPSGGQSPLLGESDNTKLSPGELGALHQKLDQISAELASAQIGTSSERQMLLAALAEGKESSTRLGRKDWKAALLGTLMAMTMSGAVSADTMRAAWGVLHNAFDAAQKLLGP